MSSKEVLQKIIDTVSSSASTSHLILLTRHEIKNESGRKTKRKNYEYDALRANISHELLSHIKRVTIHALENVCGNEELLIQEYDAISEDRTDIVYTYPTARLKAFAEILPKIQDWTNLRSVTSISEISTTLWAYCFVIEMNGDDSKYIFRRLKKAKITSDDPQSIKEKFFATFSLDTATLTIAAKEMIAFDEYIDCILSDEKFLILNKHPFEQLVGIEDEFIEQASDVIAALHENSIIEDISTITQIVNESPLLLRQVTSIARKGYFAAISQTNFDEMNEILKRMTSRELSISASGKIELSTKDAVKDLIKLLNDFWKQGLVSKKIYESNSGEIVEK